ncbi:2-oxoglutarate-dependent dioxygenase [Fulvia fulva]|uniref:2-oxoglutarate-dependent dioxygenase n=1 Tax=Passalora fulva TaxID=5499 RepID=A0A9Q8LHN5_PASFU|nr:2-oxoglutarate-dependent dioxygenase [Fulvia fulva]KAK4624687.1 2-oxoglutarate-dependent dioxygenase [Fulvia fulva]KAK4625997.1 2-oxoglutarate-dependent dioxygenase [Fulvia fulva]UJO17560.1 2-oxoglutarate-dependent dioxygenase [Fulvia fulva]WPV14881.1 2-oxoglutarate-dependent dioxygenase [Fulvia fulva]WPV30602.1 2-oxoglutarate-dependent dioxygenase [Fulvia fulva]
MTDTESNIPVVDLSWASDPVKKQALLKQLRAALFDVGFLYIINHGVAKSTTDQLASLLPHLFALRHTKKAAWSKTNSPHFLGYSGFAEETTLGRQDLREQFDFATELPVVYNERKDIGTNAHQTDTGSSNGTTCHRDLSKLYWRLRGPNQWPSEEDVPGFREALTNYHDALQALSCRFVNLIEEAFNIPVGTFDHFFGLPSQSNPTSVDAPKRSFLPPQHRIKLCRYPPADPQSNGGQGVGAHKDSSGWLTFLYQVGNEPGLEVLSSSGHWLPVKPIEGCFVVNVGNAFEAATEGTVKATIHRVIAPAQAVMFGTPSHSFKGSLLT